MKPVSPVVPGAALPETVFAKDQPEYIPLPAHVTTDGYVISRWRLSWKERLRLFFRGDIYHWQGAFGNPLQPISISVDAPETT